MEERPGRGRVLQMRLVVEAADYDEAVRFYRDVLGAGEELQVHGDAGEKVTILDVGRAAPTVTPWASLNSRLAAPGGLQLTVFEELDPDVGRT